MTDSSMEFKEEQPEKVLIENMAQIEDRIEKKLKEIDQMMVVEPPPAKEEQ